MFDFGIFQINTTNNVNTNFYKTQKHQELMAYD